MNEDKNDKANQEQKAIIEHSYKPRKPEQSSVKPQANPTVSENQPKSK